MHAQYLYYSSTKNNNASSRSISVLFGKTNTGSILSESDDGSWNLTLLGFWTLSISHTKKKNLMYWIYFCPHVEWLHLMG
jgi:hypothetical protein